MFGVFHVKNHDFTPKNLIFSNFRGGARRVRPPLDPPLRILFYMRRYKREFVNPLFGVSLNVFYKSFNEINII